MKLSHVLETAVYAPNLHQAGEFYTRLLDCEPYHRETNRYIFYKLTEAMLLLFNPEVTAVDNHELPTHGSRGPGHVCFRINENEIEAWKKRLGDLEIPIESEHVWPNGSTSLYFRDPAGNSLELAPWRIWNRFD